MIDLGTLGGLWSTAVAINNQRQVAGTSAIAVDGPAHAFVWQHGDMIDLGTLGGDASEARALNMHGHATGVSTTTGGQNHAFVWQRGRMTDLGTLGGSYSEARAINNRGQVVGTSATAYDQVHAFVWERGRMTDLGTLGGSYSAAVAINHRGQVVGWSATRNAQEHAVLWHQGRQTDLGTLGGTTSAAVAINDRGLVAGTSTTASGTVHAFVSYDSVTVDLGTLGGTASTAAAINEQGQIVGSSSTNRGDDHAVLWTVAPVDNRLVNTGFEDDRDGDQTPDVWSLAALATTNTAVTHTGTSSLRLQSNANRDFSVWQAIYGVRPGMTVDVSAWVTIPATRDTFTFQLAVAWKDQIGSVLRVDTVKTWSGPTQSWTHGTTALVVPAGTDHAVVRLEVTSLAATVYVDDVMFTAR